MATTPKGITFYEFAGYPTINITRQGLTAQRKFRVPWTSWEDFAEEIYGVYVDVGGQVVYETPLPFPGERDLLLPDTMDIKPYGGEGATVDGSAVTTMASGTNSYGQAEVLVTYRERFDGQDGGPGTVSVPEGTYLTFEGDHAIEMLTIPNRAFKWQVDSAPLPNDINPGIPVPTGQFALSWHNVLRPPYSAMSTLRGKINDATFFGASVGTLLYLGSSFSRTFAMRSSRDKATLWNITHRFAEKKVTLFADLTGGWNYFIDPRSQTWRLIHTKDTSQPVFAGGDFTTLFEYE